MPIGDTVVKCGDCNWQGSIQQLTKVDHCYYCPSCGREFFHFPPRQPEPQNEGQKNG